MSPQQAYAYPARPSREMADKIVVITGANSGIGFAAAKNLARRGAHLVIVCRNETRARHALAAIREAASGKEPVLLLADLSSQSDVRRLAAQIRQRVPRIDVLINNAGPCFSSRELSVDGVEKTLAINHLAPFLMTNLLVDLAVAAPQGRIITVASESYPGRLHFENLQGERTYNFFAAYARSKLANILFSNELARRLAGTRATSNAMSPGPTITGFGDNMRGAPALFPRIMKRMPFMKMPYESCVTLVFLAQAPEVAAASGRFFIRCREMPMKAIARDEVVARRLWEVGERLTEVSSARMDAPMAAPA